MQNADKTADPIGGRARGLGAAPASRVHQPHHFRRITQAGGGIRRKDGIQFCPFRRGEGYFNRGHVLFQIAPVLGAGNRDDVLPWARTQARASWEAMQPFRWASV